MDSIVVSSEGVVKLTKGLNPSKPLGPDELHPKGASKWTRSSICAFVSAIFWYGWNPQRNGFSQTFAPLFKKGDRALACNYRTVSLTCVPYKLLEHIVSSNIMAHLDEYQLLSDRQHVFRKRHNCETQLTTVINDRVKSWTKEDKLTHLFGTSRRLSTLHLMNFFKANYLVMALAERHSGGCIPFFAIEHNELL